LTARRAVALAFLVAISTLTVATATTARLPSPSSTLEAAEFRPVVIGDSVVGTTEPLPSIDYGTPANPIKIGDFQEQQREFGSRPDPNQPVRAEALVKPKPQPRAAAGTGGGGSHSVRGTASWYCKAGVSACHYAYPGGLYAAAGPALRVGSWRGRTVTVCGSGNCVNVKLIDWCACGSGGVIDLYSDAFSRLAPLSSGTLSVRVSW
jgi:rare lipoprotein A (peptidoglycan hydrolase)